MHRQRLKALKRIVLTHCRGAHPDLALLARDLGGAIRRHDMGHEITLEALARQVRPTDGPVHLPLHVRRGAGVHMAVLAWPADHATTLHGHSAGWGLEIALHGALEVETWRRDPLTGQPRHHGRHWLGPGDALWFEADQLPLHRCRNLSRRDTALTLHVYGGAAPGPVYLPPARSAGSGQAGLFADPLHG